ncbi:PREDICTED: pseudouridine-metabolizing bifunctional protein C1861.05-like [Nanorana parkeri]|uniref:pseudouridine-metabolizing bifunctional protein C1861.05-like n=1 Tax=Nanorana parkeri TaxID=125878 RepID=UPI000854B15C|nr:PREDICTED: pseudouridine-metabolizing bifunctional protein C1861.05-like [Nanorana parkeri]XP_018426001.1 PREDICTED: pseudouridine-metabolizing bifunctional protein C1861.05-like [Nanorana parkeri]
MLASALRRCSAVVRAGVPVTPGQAYRHSSTFRIHPSVEEALAEGRPVVALESTIVTHGMPYPQNIRMANEVEEIVQSNGSVPATVGIIEGKVHIGLCEEELKFLATSKGCVKVSRRDLPHVLSQGLSGGSTVSGTMIAAHHAGISVFVTGGIGGVHRDGENTMDVSADLTELGRTPVAVISAGVKSILDIGRTLEYLETEGVCVTTFGDSRDFPAFFTPRSGYRAPCNVCNEEEAARLIAHSLELRLGSGVLIAVPIPPEHAASGEMIEKAIQQALKEARLQGISGKDVTPFVLQRVNELTGGRSLESNIALVKNNAKVGSRIAAALSQIQKPKGGIRKDTRQQERQTDENQDSKPVVIGGINVDFIAKASQDKMEFGGQTNPGQVHQSFGGVGRNLADCLSRLGVRPLFISAMGQDDLSRSVLQYCSHMDMRGVAQLKGHSTATYCAVITGSGDLSLGVGDMEIHQQITEKHISQFADSLRQSRLVCIDGNVPVSTIQYVCEITRENRVPVCYEPTDIDKASKPFTSDSWTALTYISPNVKELISINRTLGYSVDFDVPRELDDVIDMAITLSLPLLENLYCVIVTLGAHGVLLCGHSCHGLLSLHPKDKTSRGDLCAVHYPAAPISNEEIVNVSGAGDSLMSGLLSGVLEKLDTDTCVRMGLLAARLSLRSRGPISQIISSTSVSVRKVAEETWPEPRVWTIHPTNGKSFLRTSH